MRTLDPTSSPQITVWTKEVSYLPIKFDILRQPIEHRPLCGAVFSTTTHKRLYGMESSTETTNKYLQWNKETTSFPAISRLDTPTPTVPKYKYRKTIVCGFLRKSPSPLHHPNPLFYKSCVYVNKTKKKMQLSSSTLLCLLHFLLQSLFPLFHRLSFFTALGM